MLRELINFTHTLSDDFKSLGIQPKEGLHILLKVDDNGNVQTKADSIAFDFYSKKIKGDVSPTLQKCLMLQENAWCVNTSKCYDSTAKAIHTCSPYSIAFKRDHLKGGEKFKSNQEEGKLQIQERFKDYYFEKTKGTIDAENDFQVNAFQSFADLFINRGWSVILEDILSQRSIKLDVLSKKENELNEAYKNEKDKIRKNALKDAIDELKEEIIKCQPLSDSDYILFYLDMPLDNYKEAHCKYLGEVLLGNVESELVRLNDETYGINKIFSNTLNSKKPFLTHKTSFFEFSNRISQRDIKSLYELEKIFRQKHLPKPLPLFIYRDELFDEEYFSLCKENGEKLTFRKIVENLYEKYTNVFSNYYLLNWFTSKSIEVNDFDFVSKFEYKVKGNEGLKISNFFHIQAKKEDKQKGEKHYADIHNIFELEDRVLKYLIQNKYHRVDYFSDFKKEDYENRDLTFLSYTKYRKAVYDHVYKSNRYAITGDIFKEMIFNSILDDVKNDNEYGIKEKLNIWYSLQDYFYEINNQNTSSMGSELINYEKYVADIINESADLDKATDKHFAFAAGQIIYYLLTKSKAQDNGLKLIEPYLQKTNAKSLQQNIAEDFKRYSHESFSDNFKKVSAFVLSYETDINLKELQPQLLSGLFAKNQIYPTKNNQEN